jgi:hypothetical protein
MGCIAVAKRQEQTQMKLFLASIAALLLATAAAQATSDDLYRCGNKFFRVYTHSWPAHPPTLPRVTISITRTDPDGDEWDEEGKEVSRRLVRYMSTLRGDNLFFRGRKCEHMKDFLFPERR